MNIQEINPELQRFIEEQVKSGAFSSPTEVIEAGLARLMLDEEEEMDDEEIAAIEKAEEQIKRGQYRDFSEIAAEIRAKYQKK